MTNREEQFEQLSAYLDGELTAKEALELEGVLHADPDMQAELESLRQTRDLLRQLPQESAPDHFAHAVMARAEKHHHLGKANPAGMYRSWRWIQMATAAVVLLAAGLGLIVIKNLQLQKGTETVVVEGPPPEPLVADGPSRAAEAEPVAVPMAIATAGDIDAAPASPALPAVVTEVIWTDDLALAQRQVENVLAVNDIEAVEWDESAAMGGPKAMAVNSYQAAKTDGRQIQLVVNIEADQVDRLRLDLTKLRNQQVVAQSFAPGSIDRYESKDAGSRDDPAAGSRSTTVTSDDQDLALRAEEAEARRERANLPREEELAAAKADPPAATTADRAAAYPGVVDKDEPLDTIIPPAESAAAAARSEAPLPLEDVPDFSSFAETADTAADEGGTDDAMAEAADIEYEAIDAVTEEMDQEPGGAPSGDVAAADAIPDESLPAMQQVVIYLNRAPSPIRRASPMITDDDAESRN